MGKMITDHTEICVYFELIRQLAPKKLLDFGMFLKRIGAVSRQAMDLEIAEKIKMTAVDLFPEVAFPVYTKVYNQIIPLHAWEPKERYDLTCFFSVNEELGNQRRKYWKQLVSISDCLISDTRDPEFTQFLVDHFRAQAVEVNGKTYAVAYRM